MFIDLQTFALNPIQTKKDTIKLVIVPQILYFRYRKDIGPHQSAHPTSSGQKPISIETILSFYR